MRSKKTYDPSVNLELGRPIKKMILLNSICMIYPRLVNGHMTCFYDKDLIDEINQWLNNPYCELIDKSVLGKIFSFYPIKMILIV